MPTDKEVYEETFSANCKLIVPLIKKMIGTESADPVGNYYFMCLSAGKTPMLLITLKKKDPEGNTVRGRGKAQKKTVKMLASSKWCTGDILIRNGRIIFIDGPGPAGGDLMRKAFLEIAKANSRLNVLKKAKFKIPEELEAAEVDEDSDASEVSDQDMLDLGMSPAEVHHALVAMGRDPSLSALLNPENLAEITAQTKSLNKNLARAEGRVQYDESGLPCGTLEVEVGSSVPTSFAAALEEPNDTTTSMVDDRHELSASVVIKVHKEALDLPAAERAEYVKARIDMLKEHNEAANDYVSAYRQSL